MRRIGGGINTSTTKRPKEPIRSTYACDSTGRRSLVDDQRFAADRTERSTELHFGLFLLVITCCVQVLAQAPVPKQAVIEVPFELIHGEIIVPVTVNGAGPFWMLLDT